MKTTFKRRIIGYKPAQVKTTLKSEEYYNDKLIKAYQLELLKLIEENNKLKTQIHELKEKKSGHNGLRNKLEKVLLDTHIEACKKIIKTKYDFNKMIENKINILNKQVAKNNQIKLSVNDLSLHVESILKK